jgi:hypothetical protein
MPYKMEEENHEASQIARTRAAFANRADAFNELRAAKVDSAALRLQSLSNQVDSEQSAAAAALESGNWAEHAQRQRNVAELAVARTRAEDEQRYWENQPVHHRDPVEALIQSKASEPETVAWLRAHPADALALATGGRRAAKIQGAHADAIAEGHTPGTREYFGHVDRFLGGKATGGKRQVHVVKAGQVAHGDDQLTPGEYKAATETVCWGYENPAKRGQPIGPEEYLRRRNEMRNTPGNPWFGKLD